MVRKAQHTLDEFCKHTTQMVRLSLLDMKHVQSVAHQTVTLFIQMVTLIASYVIHIQMETDNQLLFTIDKLE